MNPMRPKPKAILLCVSFVFVSLFISKMFYTSYTIYSEEKLEFMKLNTKIMPKSEENALDDEQKSKVISEEKETLKLRPVINEKPYQYNDKQVIGESNVDISENNHANMESFIENMDKALQYANNDKQNTTNKQVRISIPSLNQKSNETFSIPSPAPYIPSRRIVHLDLKGAPPKMNYYQEFFKMIKQLGATGILLEWEDMFPYTGVLESCRNGNAYSMDEVKLMFQWAQENDLEIIPLVQTFGHLEWILKHEKFAHLREVDRYSQTICVSNPEAIDLIKTIIDQVITLHQTYENGSFFHIGADEAFQFGMCQKCSKSILSNFSGNKDMLMLKHIKTIANYVQEKYQRRVLIWHDMIEQVPIAVLNDSRIDSYVEPVIWCYAEDVALYIRSELWHKFSTIFPNVWAASAFKGADGPDRYYSNVPHYMKNHLTWSQVMSQRYSQFQEFRGIIITGWQRYDHFAILCELLPVGIPSLAINLLLLKNAGLVDPTILNNTRRILGCKLFTYGNAYNCQYPAYKVYHYVQLLKSAENNMKENIFQDNTYKGWMNEFNFKHNYSSSWSIDRILRNIDVSLQTYENLSQNLRLEMEAIFYKDTVDEFISTYVDSMIEKLIILKKKAIKLEEKNSFPLRPFPIEIRSKKNENVTEDRRLDIKFQIDL